MGDYLNRKNQHFPCGSASQESSLVTAVNLVTAVVQVQSLAWELPHVVSMAKNKNKEIPFVLFVCLFCFCFLFFVFCLFAISWAAPAAYGGSQARGLIREVAASLCQSHSKAGSEPHLQPTPQLTATLGP